MSTLSRENGRSEKPTHEEIAALAYQLYREDGCKAGNDMQNWLKAEAMLTHSLQASKNAPKNLAPAKAPNAALLHPLDEREHPLARDERGSASREEIRHQQIPPAARQSQRGNERSRAAK